MARPGEPRAAFPSTLPHPRRLFKTVPPHLFRRHRRSQQSPPARFSPCAGGFAFCSLLVQDYAPCRSMPRPSRKSLGGDGYLQRYGKPIAFYSDTSCLSMRNEPERRPARDPGPRPIVSLFFSRWRPEAGAPTLPFHNFLRASAGRDRAKHFVAFFCRAARLCGPVSCVTISSLLPYVLFPATGAD